MAEPPQKRRRLALVDFPGTVENDQKAIEMLGGLSSVEKIRDPDSKFLTMNFNPSRPLDHPLHGDIAPASRLVVRSKAGSEQVEIVGCVDKQVTYKGLCHFQLFNTSNFLPLNCCDSFMNGNSSTMMVTPHSLTRFDTPRHYRFLDSRIDHRKRVEERSGRAKRAKAPAAPRRRTKDARIPLKKWDGKIPVHPPPHSEMNSNEVHALPVVLYLKKKFMQRKVWLLDRLLLEGDEFTEEELNQYLPAVAYRFGEGPWRQCWLQYGYNPLEVTEARMYQCVEVRVSETEAGALGIQNTHVTMRCRHPQRRQEASAKASLGDVSRSHDPTFSTVPVKMNSLYQLCDFRDPALRAIVENASISPKVTKQSGWFQRSTIDELRKAMKATVAHWVALKQAGKPVPQVPSWEEPAEVKQTEEDLPLDTFPPPQGAHAQAEAHVQLEMDPHAQFPSADVDEFELLG